MHCFYHEQKEAVGICKSCGKGVCKKCAVDLKKGLACRGHCVDSVLSIIKKNSEYDKYVELYRKRSEEYQKQCAEFDANDEKFKKSQAVWEKTMSDYEKMTKFRKPSKN